MTKERRKNPRIELRFNVKIGIKLKGPHKVQDLSVGGLFIRTTNPSVFGEGDEIRLVMREPADNKLMRLDARVAHVAKNGIGVEFLNMMAEDQKALEYCFSLAFLVSPYPALVERRQDAYIGWEKRRSRRVDIHFQVKIGMNQEGPHEVQDLSVGGLFIETTNPSEFRERDEIELVMREPADNKLMRLDARVAHVAKNGIGVEFLNATAEDQKALNTCFDVFRHTLPKIGG
jgi:c-di-GMP-binding flagellar brake protein YcgR